MHRLDIAPVISCLKSIYNGQSRRNCWLSSVAPQSHRGLSILRRQIVLYRAALISESRIKNLTESFLYLIISGGRCRSVLRHRFSAVVLLEFLTFPGRSFQLRITDGRKELK